MEEPRFAVQIVEHEPDTPTGAPGKVRRSWSATVRFYHAFMAQECVMYELLRAIREFGDDDCVHYGYVVDTTNGLRL